MMHLYMLFQSGPFFFLSSNWWHSTLLEIYLLSYASTCQISGSLYFVALIWLMDIILISSKEITKLCRCKLQFLFCSGPNLFICFFICRYEDAYNRFIDEINSVAAYEWWEGSVHRILSVLAYPCAWSWKQWRRRKKIQRLQEFVTSEYDHSCLRSCRSRALYKGMKVSCILVTTGCASSFS